MNVNRGWSLFWAAELGVLVLVVVAAILLIAGYGAPVGIGLLVGVGLGVVAAFVVTMTTGWTRRVMTFGGGPVAGAGGGGWTRVVEERPPRREMAFIETLHRLQGVEDSPLLSVVPAGQSVDAAGFHLQLIAVELRQAGGLALVVASAEPPRVPPGHFAQVTVEDDAGTAYVAAGQSSMGGPRSRRYDLKFAPAPPLQATKLMIRIDELTDPFPMAGPNGPEPIRGPWTFTIPLTPR